VLEERERGRGEEVRKHGKKHHSLWFCTKMGDREKGEKRELCSLWLYSPLISDFSTVKMSLVWAFRWS